MAEETRVEKLPELAPPEPETKTSAQFDRAAKDWESNPLAPRAAEKAVADFLSTVPLNAESTVIELGCGSGLCTELIARKVGAILGLDTSKAMIKQFEARAARVQLQDKMAGVRIELKDPKQLQDYLPDERGFDIAFSHRALHHLPDFRASLKVLAQVVRPGGWLFVTDVGIFKDEDLHANGNRNGSLHRQGLKIAELEQGLVAAGLVDVSVKRCFNLDEGADGKESKETWYLRGLGRRPRKVDSQKPKDSIQGK